MSQKKPLVSIVVLNWNGLDDTRECLTSLRALAYPNTEIIVVDNGSTDGSKEFLEKQKDIVYIDLDKNYGFTGGHIRGYEVAKGEYLAIINNDLVLDKNWIDASLKTMRSHDKVAVVGGKSFKWNKENPIFNQNNDFFSWQTVNPATGHTRMHVIGDDERQADGLSGAALLFDIAALKVTGYLDDDFFAYYEETDLIARILRAGYTAYYTPDAMAWHKIAASTKGGEASYFYLYMMHRNRFIFALKNLDDKQLKQFKRYYLREFLGALYRRLRHADNDNRARVNAYIWSIKNRQKVLTKRREVLTLGPSYVTHLNAHQPKDVTVIIPSYNYGQYVDEAINSVLAQSLPATKIIVINDGSTDDTKEILKKYENNDLFEIINKKNTGVIDTKNIGLSKTKTTWTLFFDADDILENDFLEKTVNHALETNCDVAYTDMELFGTEIRDEVFHASAYSPSRLIRKNFINNSALISTSLLKQIGGYKPIMKDGLEDWELYLSLAEYGARFCYVPEPVFRYRQHAGALSRNGAVLQREKELYNLLLSLHPGMRKYASRPRRWTLSIVKGVYNFIRHPSLWVVLLKSIPRATMAFVETIVHRLRAHKAKLDTK